jgi:glyoxylase-like metal-dependent hydrolase (beta-lactamase superfamily II)
MRQLADDLYLLRGFPPNAINVYLMGDVIIDTGSRHAAGRILKQVKGRDVGAVALTHAHPDHDGSAKEVCERLGVPLWVGERDVHAMEHGMPPAEHPVQKLSARAMAGPRHHVDRALKEGDVVAGFTVLDVPGHSPGHVAYWRSSDRTLVLGDVLFGIHPLTGRRQLREPPDFFTPDPPQNRESARKLAALEPALVCFGHGPPERDTKRFTDFVAGLARD